jgi:hypothetical protein
LSILLGPVLVVAPCWPWADNWAAFCTVSPLARKDLQWDSVWNWNIRDVFSRMSSCVLDLVHRIWSQTIRTKPIFFPAGSRNLETPSESVFVLLRDENVAWLPWSFSGLNLCSEPLSVQSFTIAKCIL